MLHEQGGQVRHAVRRTAAGGRRNDQVVGLAQSLDAAALSRVVQTGVAVKRAAAAFDRIDMEVQARQDERRFAREPGKERVRQAPEMKSDARARIFGRIGPRRRRSGARNPPEEPAGAGEAAHEAPSRQHALQDEADPGPLGGEPPPALLEQVPVTDARRTRALARQTSDAAVDGRAHLLRLRLPLEQRGEQHDASAR